MSKFRKHTHDAPEPIKRKKITPGDLPPSRIPIYDAKGNRRGHVGFKASAATVAGRFGVPNPRIGQRNGRVAWIGGKTLAQVSAEGTNPAIPAPTIGGSK
jgi:hypothetical protein